MNSSCFSWPCCSVASVLDSLKAPTPSSATSGRTSARPCCDPSRRLLPEEVASLSLCAPCRVTLSAELLNPPRRPSSFYGRLSLTPPVPSSGRRAPPECSTRSISTVWILACILLSTTADVVFWPATELMRSPYIHTGRFSSSLLRPHSTVFTACHVFPVSVADTRGARSKAATPLPHTHTLPHCDVITRDRMCSRGDRKPSGTPAALL